MAVNPMQRKARNSFLLGMLLSMLITGTIIALLIIQLKNYREKEAEEQANSVRIWALSQNVISGQVITKDMLKQQIINKDVVPSNAIGDMTILDNYALQDKEGNNVITEYKNNVATMYLNKNNTKYELKQEDATGSYYIETNGDKEYVDLITTPIVAKVDMNKNTVLTIDTITKADEKTTDDLRKQEFNMLVLPTQIKSGEYVDVRLAMPSGEDYIVVAKKQVKLPQIGGVDSADTIWLNLSEEEIITMNSAIVDAYRVLGSKLYVTTYTEAGVQAAATPTYVPTGAVMKLIEQNPNIVQLAKNTLITRYNNTAGTVRNEVINPAINANGQDGTDNLESKVQESITNSKDQRQQYLDSLTGE